MFLNLSYVSGFVVRRAAPLTTPQPPRSQLKHILPDRIWPFYLIIPFCFKVMFLIRPILNLQYFLMIFVLALLVSVFKWRALRYLGYLVSSCLIFLDVAYDASHLSQVYAKGEVLAPKFRPKIARWKSWLDNIDNIANTMQMKGFSSKVLQILVLAPKRCK